MAKVLDRPSHSLREFRILPGYTPPDGNALNVQLTTRLCRSKDDFLRLQTPFMTAAMQAVTGTEMAIAIAQLGGIGILPVSQPIEEQVDKLGRVKRFKAGFQTNITTLSPRNTIGDIIHIMEEMGYTTFPVTDSG
ncbi:MAG: IMP dehydrogenase, partial [bacterium]|nr:IMP dehydrogenase [bacterium]